MTSRDCSAFVATLVLVITTALIAVAIIATIGVTGNAISPATIMVGLLLGSWLRLIAAAWPNTVDGSANTRTAGIRGVVVGLVDRSFFGAAGAVSLCPALSTGGLERVRWPVPTVDATREPAEPLVPTEQAKPFGPPNEPGGPQLPPEQPAYIDRRIPQGSPRSMPRTARPATLLSGTPYTVARGDSYWALAERLFGDGQRWTEIRDMNGAREVAPGLTVDVDHERLSPGWSILIPEVQTAPIH